jgi:predicted lipid carrier protein YhbT
MSKWLSQEWLDAQVRLAKGQPERPGATARMQYMVTGAPDGDIAYYWVLEDGHLLEAKLGEVDEPEVTLTQSYDDAMAIQRGELDATAAFMQGRVRVTGNMAKLMALLPITTSKEYQALQAELLEMTEFDPPPA